MATEEKKDTPKIKSFDPKKSIRRARTTRREGSKWVITTSGGKVEWSNRLERVAIIRKGLPYDSIEVIGQKANMPVRQVLHYFGVAQTTYNKKKRENEMKRILLLSGGALLLVGLLVGLIVGCKKEDPVRDTVPVFSNVPAAYTITAGDATDLLKVGIVANDNEDGK